MVLSPVQSQFNEAIDNLRKAKEALSKDEWANAISFATKSYQLVDSLRYRAPAPLQEAVAAMHIATEAVWSQAQAKYDDYVNYLSLSVNLPITHTVWTATKAMVPERSYVANPKTTMEIERQDQEIRLWTAIINTAKQHLDEAREELSKGTPGNALIAAQEASYLVEQLDPKKMSPTFGWEVPVLQKDAFIISERARTLLRARSLPASLGSAISPLKELRKTLLSRIFFRNQGDPVSLIRGSINAMLEMPEKVADIRASLELARQQLGLPEWKDNPYLERALKAVWAATLLNPEGEKLWLPSNKLSAVGEKVQPLITLAQMSLRAAHPHTPEVVLSTSQQQAAFLKSRGRQGSIFEHTMISPPASKRMEKVDDYLVDALDKAWEDDWQGANQSLFAATILARTIRNSPLSKKEREQAKIFLDDEIPRRAYDLQQVYDQLRVQERVRERREEISPFSPPEALLGANATVGLGALRPVRSRGKMTANATELIKSGMDELLEAQKAYWTYPTKSARHAAIAEKTFQAVTSLKPPQSSAFHRDLAETLRAFSTKILSESIAQMRPEVIRAITGSRYSYAHPKGQEILKELATEWSRQFGPGFRPAEWSDTGVFVPPEHREQFWRTVLLKGPVSKTVEEILEKSELRRGPFEGWTSRVAK